MRAQGDGRRAGRERGGPEAAERFRSTRAAHRAERAEDYVEAIAELTARLGQARVVDLARHMGVSHVTVSRTVTRLRAEGLVEKGRGPLELTPAGSMLAKRAEERHEVVLRFLLELGVPLKQAMVDSEGIEHHVSEQTIAAMRRWGRGG